MAVFPKYGSLGDLPEFPHMPHWGIGPTKGEGVAAVIESDLLQEPHQISTPTGAITIPTGTVTVHEFAHAVMALCFTPEDHAEVRTLYKDALRANAFHGSYAIKNASEFFAETSVLYFDMPTNPTFENQPTQDTLRTFLPQIFAFMERVYGEPPSMRTAP